MPQLVNSGYKKGATRARFDDRFEAQIRPFVRCRLLPTDWALAVTQVEIAQTLNSAFERVVNAGEAREEVERRMTGFIASLYAKQHVDLIAMHSVLQRLLRATFEY
jgi:hypothetical protein